MRDTGCKEQQTDDKILDLVSKDLDYVNAVLAESLRIASVVPLGVPPVGIVLLEFASIIYRKKFKIQNNNMISILYLDIFITK